MLTAFISYRREPSAMLAKWLAEQLQAYDIDCFIDAEGLDAGNFSHQLQRAIRTNDVFVCLIAETTFDSQWVKDEIAYARSVQKPMIPVFHDRYDDSVPVNDANIGVLLMQQGVRIHEKDPLYVLNADVKELVRLIYQAAQPIPQQVSKRSVSWRMWRIGALILFAVVGLVLLLSGMLSGNNEDKGPGTDIQTEEAAVVPTSVLRVTTKPTNTPDPTVTNTPHPTLTLLPTSTPQLTASPSPQPTMMVVRVGLNASYPPFEFLDGSNNIIGFDVDMMNAIAEKSGFVIEVVSTRWDGIFTALQSGVFDVVCSAATITNERKSIVNFSTPYFNTGQMIVVRASDANTIMKLNDLAGLRVGVQAGTTAYLTVRNLPDVEIVLYEDILPVFSALAAGEIDAIVNDGAVSADIIARYPDLDAVLVGEPLTNESFGIAVRTNQSELLSMINKGLATIIADGTYAAIYEKWFGMQPPSQFRPS